MFFYCLGPPFSSPAFSGPPFSGQADATYRLLVLHFPVLQIPPSEIWSYIFWSCIFSAPMRCYLSDWRMNRNANKLHCCYAALTLSYRISLRIAFCPSVRPSVCPLSAYTSRKKPTMLAIRLSRVTSGLVLKSKGQRPKPQGYIELMHDSFRIEGHTNLNTW